MHMHILGICGTFMGGIAALAKQMGHEVTGSDEKVYPPMSSQLRAQGIALYEGYDAAQFANRPDLVLVGNAMVRGNPAVEYLLAEHLPYCSGPQWLAEQVLAKRRVVAVAGTHGKTTTSSMIAWILEQTGYAPGFLIGGVPENFGVSARLGAGDVFVIEADEYDSAFFDKRSKFVHYRPDTLVLNNLEFDHADIFESLDEIKTQFHHLVRTVPNNGLIIYPSDSRTLAETLALGCWTPTAPILGAADDWQLRFLAEDGRAFAVHHQGQWQGEVHWSLLGQHNAANALAALVACQQVGVPLAESLAALPDFKSVKRRMEIRGQVAGVTVYDDFAHHPTAIAAVLSSLRANIGEARLLAVVEFGSYTMRTGYHRDRIAKAFTAADHVVCLRPHVNDWGLDHVVSGMRDAVVLDSVDLVREHVLAWAKPGDHVMVMSNSGFGDIHTQLLAGLAAQG